MVKEAPEEEEEASVKTENLGLERGICFRSRKGA